MISVEEERLLKENKDVEPVKAFLLAALVSKSKGDGYNYSQVVNQIRMRQDQVEHICLYVLIFICTYVLYEFMYSI
jgi:hypothetical protein